MSDAILVNIQYTLVYTDGRVLIRSLENVQTLLFIFVLTPQVLTSCLS